MCVCVTEGRIGEQRDGEIELGRSVQTGTEGYEESEIWEVIVLVVSELLKIGTTLNGRESSE